MRSAKVNRTHLRREGQTAMGAILIFRLIEKSWKEQILPSVVVWGRLRSTGSFVPSKIISVGSRPRPISGEPGEYRASWRLDHSVRIAREIRRGQAELVHPQTRTYCGQPRGAPRLKHLNTAQRRCSPSRIQLLNHACARISCAPAILNMSLVPSSISDARASRKIFSIPYSLLSPLPPNTCSASLATSKAA